MTSSTGGFFPTNLKFSANSVLYQNVALNIQLHNGFTTLVGPNGAGKTQSLRQLKNLLKPKLAPNFKVRFLSAGRSSPLERFRAAIDGPGIINNENAYVGHASYKSGWSDFESITGDYLTLHERADLRLKVEARLQTFFSRSIQLSWTQNGLEIMIVPVRGGTPYAANAEASGILQLVPLLAAIYNDQIGALLIDEPEISLHPQLQSFILQELMNVAGDPTINSTKKIIVIATHSISMLPIRDISDLANLVFFKDRLSPPVQVSPAAPELQRRKLSALIARLSATHKLAFFAENVLLVEGPSDEIILAQLARTLNHPILPTNTQIVPVIGKGEFAEAVKLFGLMGKRVVVLADLDALSDANTLVNEFSCKPCGATAAQNLGQSSLIAVDTALRNDFAYAVQTHWTAIEPIVSAHPYWSSCPANERSDKTRRRAALATLLGPSGDTLHAAVANADFNALKTRYGALLNALETTGCFILRRGTIESYFRTAPNGASKPEAAAEEAATFDSASTSELETDYADILRAIRSAAGTRPVDENELLREKLGAAIGAMFQSLEQSTTDAELNGRARATFGTSMDIFYFENCSSSGQRKLRVTIKSPLFQRESFPFEIGENENANQVIREKLPVISNN
jgi:energy-coupling factor transporter ATP-binding protein EcfA2